ncbi:calcium-binding protein 39-like [Oppia nitens]|uniref:calcium-binding protein 39-like n=1 Tax=Oppia nitens TaxID=1686743 RepID=UPI0023D9C344|nr:calcium-binding protein 39-like [Oppia nitens]
MKFFRQRSSASLSEQQKKSLGPFNGTDYKTIDSIDETVKKLRQALNKSEILDKNNEQFNDINNKQLITNDVNDISSSSSSSSGHYSKTLTQTIKYVPNNVTNAEIIVNENNMRICLENLRQNIILHKLYFDSIAKNDKHNEDNNCGTSSSSSSNNNNVSHKENSDNSMQTKANSDDTHNTKVIKTLCEELFASHILLELILKLSQIGFENRKLTASVICNALLLQTENRYLTVEYICTEPEIIYSLIDIYKYGRSDVTFNSGLILRQCLQHQCLAKIVFNWKRFDEFFTFVNQKTFDVAMDAFITLRTLLTEHKQLTDDYMTQNGVKFFQNYIQLINSDNYVTKRQSLEILAIILSQSVIICKLFALNTTYMAIIYKLLWHKYRHIRFRALNIFHVFINNESQLSIDVMDFILSQSDRDKLLEMLNHFKNYKTKCKYFLALKPFAGKLIQFFNTSTDET